ncbi:MAG: aldehyde dehydrogenase EutE [Firmicutes bacterium]|nr:aldehyde dehydrogenase EutE [Bacillota bacterium]
MDEAEIREIVREVLSRVRSGEPPKAERPGIFADMDAAVAAARTTQRMIAAMPMEFREKIIASIRKNILKNAAALSELGVRETGMGKVGHKILKHQLVAEKTPGTEDITTTAWSGDRGLTLVERGPFGVIGAVTPSTNPSETILCNAIGMLAAGNTVVFNPHPGAKNVSNLAVEIVNRASLEAGGPENIAVSLENPTLESGEAMFRHPEIQLIVATGGPGVVTAALSTGKRAIGAGAGNPPALVDETADVPKAAVDIINGASFDNNLPCIAEKEIVAVERVADELLHHMKENGCYHASAAEVEKLMQLVFVRHNGKDVLNRKYVGADASRLLRDIGVDAGDVKLVIFEGSEQHPAIREELMMPIIGLVRVKNVDAGIELCKNLEHGNRHSAHMHSKNVDHLTKFGKALDTAIFVKNGPSYNAIGFGGEGYTTFTIASRTGEGLTSAYTFTKSRRCVMSDSLCIR